MARRFAYVLVWLGLTAEIPGFIFEGLWETPLTWVGSIIFRGMPVIHIFPWDAFVIATTLVARRGIGKSVAAPLLTSFNVTFAALAGTWLWGVLRGGSAYQTMFQLHSFVMAFFVAYMLLATCQTLKHIEGLGKVVVFATIYRSFVLLAFYFRVAIHMASLPPVMTDHADSTLFTVGLMILVINLLERRTSLSILIVLVSAVPICIAIQLNQRRIAWLNLFVGLVLSYIMMPKGAFKRLTTGILLGLAPLLVAYVVIGWGHPVGIFTPVGSVSTMFGAHQDVSSMMRDIENYNLTRTLKTNPLFGTGWGHKYIEEVQAYDISELFPQYRYLPHNSLLGLIAFTGMVGFAGIWQVVAVSSFFYARVLRVARAPLPRIVALSGLATLIMCALQMWGDLGFSHLMIDTLFGVSLGMAGRLAVLVGAWPVATASKTRNHA